ncbi:MAG: PIN domain-containing protein [Patescibacteria group bacterium]
MPKKLRVFLDTSAILAGLNSPNGAAGIILAACFVHEAIPVISPQVVEEAERVIAQKFPRLFAGWIIFLLIPPQIASPPTLAQVRKAYRVLPTNDAPILAAALNTRPDALVTWNTRDFMRPAVVEASPFPILRPGEFLRLLQRGN